MSVTLKRVQNQIAATEKTIAEQEAAGRVPVAQYANLTRLQGMLMEAQARGTAPVPTEKEIKESLSAEIIAAGTAPQEAAAKLAAEATAKAAQEAAATPSPFSYSGVQITPSVGTSGTVYYQAMVGGKSYWLSDLAGLKTIINKNATAEREATAQEAAAKAAQEAVAKAAATSKSIEEVRAAQEATATRIATEKAAADKAAADKAAKQAIIDATEARERAAQQAADALAAAQRTKEAQEAAQQAKVAQAQTEHEQKLQTVSPLAMEITIPEQVSNIVALYTGAERPKNIIDFEIHKDVAEIQHDRLEESISQTEVALDQINDQIYALSADPARYLITDPDTGKTRPVVGRDIDYLKSQAVEASAWLVEANASVKVLQTIIDTPQKWIVTYDTGSGDKTKTFLSETEAKKFMIDIEYNNALAIHRARESSFTPEEKAYWDQKYLLDKLESAGVIEDVPAIAGEKEKKILVKPVNVLTRTEEKDLREAGFDIPEMKEGLSMALYNWGEEVFKDSDEWSSKKLKERTFDDFVKSQTEYYAAMIGTGVESMTAPYAALYKFVTGNELSQKKAVTVSTLKYLEDLSPGQQASLYCGGMGASYLGSYVGLLPVGVAAQKVFSAASSIASKIPIGTISTKIPGLSKISAIPGVSKTTQVIGAIASNIAAHPTLMNAILVAPLVKMEVSTVYKMYLDGDDMLDVLGEAALRAGNLTGGLMGFGKGMEIGKDLSFPVKRGTVGGIREVNGPWVEGIPLEGGGTLQWDGYYFEYGDNAYRVSGSFHLYDDAGKLVDLTDDQIKELAKKGIKSGYKPLTKIDSQIVSEALEQLKYTADDLSKVKDVRTILSSTKNTSSNYIQDILPSETRTLSSDGISRLKKFLISNIDDVDEVYGSFAVRNQLNTAYEFALVDNPAISALRMPGDVDIMIHGSADDVERFIQNLLDELLDAGEKVRIDPSSPTTIQAYVGDGKWAHAIDGHISGAPSPDTLPPEVWGFKVDRPSLMMEDLPVMSANEQGIRKGTSILGFSDDGTLGPMSWRRKDIVDFVQVSQTLEDSKKWWAKSVQEQINRIQDLYGVVDLSDIQDIYENLAKTRFTFQVGGDAPLSLTATAFYTSLGLSVPSISSSLGVPSSPTSLASASSLSTSLLEITPAATISPPASSPMSLTSSDIVLSPPTLSTSLPKQSISLTKDELLSKTLSEISDICSIADSKSLSSILPNLDIKTISGVISSASPETISDILPKLDIKTLGSVVSSISSENLSKVIPKLDIDKISTILSSLDAKTISSIVSKLDVKDVASAMSYLDAKTVSEVIGSLSKSKIKEVIPTFSASKISDMIPELNDTSLAIVISSLDGGTLSTVVQGLDTTTLQTIIQKIQKIDQRSLERLQSLLRKSMEPGKKSRRRGGKYPTKPEGKGQEPGAAKNQYLVRVIYSRSSEQLRLSASNLPHAIGEGMHVRKNKSNTPLRVIATRI